MAIDLKNLNKNDGDTLDNNCVDLIDENFNKIKDYINNLNIPTRTKQLINDSNYLTSLEITDEVINDIKKFNENFADTDSSLGTKIKNLQDQNKEMLILMDAILSGQIVTTNDGDEILFDDGQDLTL